MSNETRRILLVEDEKAIRDAVTAYLERENYWVTAVGDGQDALEEFQKHHFDLVILDLMLPRVPGERVCRVIRDTSDVPIIMLTSSESEFDEVMAMNLGADDYVTKPFSPSELVARVDAVYRRVALAAQNRETSLRDELQSGEFTLNLRNRSLHKGEKPIELTQVEFQIMEYFFSNPGIALPRGDILKHVWGPSYVGEEKIVDVNIRRLRMKVEDQPSAPAHIVTVWGLGYRWEV